jgi:ectoine hydroxylase-related dioxygenase (phytanoyl-CoA dioxygenase family)
MRQLYWLFCFLPLAALAMLGFLTEEEIALFYTQGYVLKRHVLKEDEVEMLKEEAAAAIGRACEQAASSSKIAAAGKEQILHIDGSRVIFKQGSNESFSIARINGCCGMQPSLLKTVRSAKMVHTFFELLGTSDLEHLIAQIHPKSPGDGIEFPKHQDIQFRKSFDPDWQDIVGNGSYAVCIIPIDPMSPENGGLWIDRKNYPEPQGLEEERFWIYAEPGDLLFLHPYLYHGSGPNLSATAHRRTLLTGFCAFGANHKPYPGACVNIRLTLGKEGELIMTPAPWSQEPCVDSMTGH